MLKICEETILSHICVTSGFAFPSEYFSNDSGFPLIRIRNLLEHRTETFYSGPFDHTYRVNDGDILIGMDGDFNVVRWRGEPGLLNQRICKLTSKSELLNEGYLFHWLQPKIDEIHRKTPQTTVRHLSTKDIEYISIPFFPLNEQRRIAEILDTIDEALQKIEALISKLKAMKQGLLHDLLTRGLDKNSKLRDPKAYPEQFKDSPLGRIPKEWGINPLEKLAEVDRGKFTHRPRNDPRFYGGAYPFVQTGDIAEAEGDILKKYSQTLNSSGSVVSREFPENTIAITIAANIADTAILGRPMYFPDSIVGAIVRPPNNVRYIELCIRRAKRILNAHAPQSAQKNINFRTPYLREI